MKKLLVTFGLFICSVFNAGAVEPERHCDGLVALKRLIDGNVRFVNQKMKHPDQSMERVRSVAPHQSPFAAILCCSDSRVPPEVLFDQGVGDLFVVRNAGNVADKITMGSIQYAVEVLGVPLVVILGHSDCGAAKAAMKGINDRYITHLVKAMKPAVKTAQLLSPEFQLDQIIEANIALGCERVENAKFTPVCGKLEVIGAYYDLTTGQIEFFDPEFETQ